mmetsp:Transcript_4008/g.15106  ORF Transcript_4008/g.15106 Transcript_4008/m.15106 type:complete len:889 (-) Transcript_4008:42-2708(-)
MTQNNQKRGKKRTRPVAAEKKKQQKDKVAPAAPKQEDDHWLDSLRNQLMDDDSSENDQQHSSSHSEPENTTASQQRKAPSDSSSEDEIDALGSSSDESDYGELTFRDADNAEPDDDSDGDEPYLSDDFEVDEEELKAANKQQDDLFERLQKEHAAAAHNDDDDEADEDLAAFDIVDETEEKKKNDSILEFVDQQMGAMTNSLPADKKEKSIFDDVDYDDDSSEDESNVNTIGNAPLEWYEEYNHIGYDLSGKKIIKKDKRDTLDELIKRVDEPNKLEVYDEYNDRWVQITKTDVNMILDVMKGRFPTGVNPYRYRPEFEYDSTYPVVNNIKSKQAFLGVNLADVKQIEKLRKKIQDGWVPPFRREWKKPESNYLMWGPDGKIIDQEGIRRTEKLRAPKERLPMHSESYNPSPEYTNEGRQTFQSLREIPQPKDYVKHRLQRCLDLYLCPRVRTKKKQVDNPADLLPNLPDPSELRPFPEFQTLVYEGHSAYVRSISVNPTGTHLMSGDADGILKLWELSTSRCVRTWNFADKHPETPCIRWVEWNPNVQLNLCMIAIANHTYLIHPTESGTDTINQSTEALFPDTEYEKEPEIEIFNDDDTLLQNGENVPVTRDVNPDEDTLVEDTQSEAVMQGKSLKDRAKVLIKWKFFRLSSEKEIRDQGLVMSLEHLMPVTQISWHSKGDYFSTLSPEANNDGIVVHQLSRRHSMKPFKKRFKHKGQKVVRVMFHPTRHFFYMVLPRKIRIFNLISQKQKKVLKKSVCKYISDVDIHPGGDHVMTGGLDRRLEFFEAEVSKTPCRSLKYHKKAIRRVRFHKRYPLFASSSDDGLIHIFHCTVYDDWLRDPLIVPVKILKGHTVHNSLGVLDIEWHPTQPWILTSGADGSIRLWTS